ncbi:hypothetical protein HAHE_27510 [Haloferula helveola]|uniref:Uncharacterized protein n=1 Tax=Haloferula helveola TaxID=490095 RepID=A0ABM7RH94_9BACT|nr:hypothetical protein HAHE_27510 [Haloferula helveola]
MILPDNLKPLPVAPGKEEGAASKSRDLGDFVSEAAVKQLLVGPLSVNRCDPKFGGSRHGFAGRADVGDASPFVSLSSDEFYDEAPAKSFEPRGPHPAMAEPRRAAAPVPRSTREGEFGRYPAAERMWVMAMGVVLLAMIIGGVLFKLATREPAGSPVEHAEKSERPASALHGKAALAATDPEAGMP